MARQGCGLWVTRYVENHSTMQMNRNSSRVTAAHVDNVCIAGARGGAPGLDIL
jgi:hypothetical protein